MPLRHKVARLIRDRGVAFKPSVISGNLAALPRAQFAEASRASADNVSNVAFIAEDVNKAIGQSGSEVYLKRIQPRVLTSQCVPMDPTLWSIDSADGFWQARRDLLAAAFNEFVRDSLPGRRLSA